MTSVKSSSNFTQKEIRLLEEQSFENLVNFYSRELLLMVNGKDVDLTYFVLKSMRKKGVIRDGRKDLRNYPTLRALKVLGVTE